MIDTGGLAGRRHAWMTWQIFFRLVSPHACWFYPRGLSPGHGPRCSTHGRSCCVTVDAIQAPTADTRKRLWLVGLGCSWAESITMKAFLSSVHFLAIRISL